MAAKKSRYERYTDSHDGKLKQARTIDAAARQAERGSDGGKPMQVRGMYSVGEET
jgi:hypothetical protein